VKRTTRRLSPHRAIPGAIWRVPNRCDNVAPVTGSPGGNREVEAEVEEGWPLWLPAGSGVVAWLGALPRPA
jgi:hypothetical protein